MEGNRVGTYADSTETNVTSATPAWAAACVMPGRAAKIVGRCSAGPFESRLAGMRLDSGATSKLLTLGTSE